MFEKIEEQIKALREEESFHRKAYYEINEKINTLIESQGAVGKFFHQYDFDGSMGTFYYVYDCEYVKEFNSDVSEFRYYVNIIDFSKYWDTPQTKNLAKVHLKEAFGIFSSSDLKEITKEEYLKAFEEAKKQMLDKIKLLDPNSKNIEITNEKQISSYIDYYLYKMIKKYYQRSILPNPDTAQNMLNEMIESVGQDKEQEVYKNINRIINQIFIDYKEDTLDKSVIETLEKLNKLATDSII